MNTYNTILGQVTHTFNNNVKILYINTTENKDDKTNPLPALKERIKVPMAEGPEPEEIKK